MDELSNEAAEHLSNDSLMLDSEDDVEPVVGPEEPGGCGDEEESEAGPEGVVGGAAREPGEPVRSPDSPSAAPSGVSSASAGVDSAAAVLAATSLSMSTPPLFRAYAIDRSSTQPVFTGSGGDVISAHLVVNSVDDVLDSPASRGRPVVRHQSSGSTPSSIATPTDHHHHHHHSNANPPMPVRCINPASEVNSRLDTQVEVRVYPCNNSQNAGKKKYTGFTIKPEGVIIQGNNRNRTNSIDLGAEYAMFVGRKLQRYELSDTRACQLLVTTHGKNFWVVPAPEAFSRHSGTCRLLGDRKHPPASHTLQVGDFLRVGSVGVVVIETHDGVENRVLSEEKIQRIMKDTTNSNGGFLDLAETDGENSDDSMDGEGAAKPTAAGKAATAGHHMPTGDSPVCYMCFDEEDTEENPMITPCKCSGDTKYVHVDCLRKWHTAEADNQICFLSSVDATCSVCKTTFKSDFKLKDGRQVKLFKSSLEPPYVSLLVATKHEMAQRLFNTRFQLSFSTLLKPDGRNGTRPLLLGRSSGSDMVLDYRTVSARHASIRFKNGEFIFMDAGSSNGSYLYLRRPLQLSPSQPVQFRLGRSMISMKVVNKWNRRLLRAVRRTGQSGGVADEEDEADDRSIGSADGDVRVTDGNTGMVTKTIHRRSREAVMRSLPAPGQLSQQSSKHLDLLYALAYPKRDKDTSLSRSNHGLGSPKSPPSSSKFDEMKEEENGTTAAIATSPTETIGVEP